MTNTQTTDALGNSDLHVWLRLHSGAYSAIEAAINLSQTNGGAKVFLHSDSVDRESIAMLLDGHPESDGRSGFTCTGRSLDGVYWIVRVM